MKRLSPISIALAGGMLSLMSPCLIGQETNNPFQQGAPSVSPFQQEAPPARSGDDDQVIATLTQDLQSNPSDPTLYFKRAYRYMAEAKFDLAIADLNQAIVINPQFEKAYYRRAFVYMAKGDYDKAAADLTQEIQINPQNAKAYIRRAYVYMIVGDYDQTVADLSQVLQMDPTNAMAFARRTKAYMFKGDYANAIAGLNQMIQKNPKDIPAFNTLAWLLATCPQSGFRNGTQAVENAASACQLTDWKAPPSLDTLAAAYAEAGDFNNAVKWENQAISASVNADMKQQMENRLALYEAHQPYHVDKYDPHVMLLIN